MGIKHKPEPKVRHNGSIGGIVAFCGFIMLLASFLRSCGGV